MINQKISWIRRVILLIMIGLFLILSGLFLKQNRQNNRVEKSLEAAYSYSLSNSKGIDNLYHIFSEADMTFRMFTLNFEQDLFDTYQVQMMEVQSLIDSLNYLTAGEDESTNALIDLNLRDQYLQEFAHLRKNLDSLLIQSEMTHVVISQTTKSNNTNQSKAQILLEDTLSENQTVVHYDTVVSKREGLLKRIFNPSQDTLIVNNEGNTKIRERLIGIPQEAENQSTSKIQVANTPSLGNIRSTIRRLQTKEEQLIISTYDILNSIQVSIAHLKDLEISTLRSIESKDFNTYKKNAQDINRQFVLGLTIMAILIFILIYHQWNASKMEKRLLREVQYSNTIAKEKTEVLASISHEVRTPLVSLLHISKLLKNDSQLTENEEQRTLLDSVYYHVEYANNTINDILTLNKLEEKDGNFISKPENWQDFSIKNCFVDIISLHKNPADLKSIEITEDFEKIENLIIKSDPFPIKQAISNFLSNAIKHTAPGGKIKIHAQFINKNSEDNTNFLLVNVEDSGIGIPKESQKNIFRKYYCLNNTTGFGLGLYISKKLIRSLDGKIGFFSEENKGSTFYIQIPISDFKYEKQMIEKSTLNDPSNAPNCSNKPPLTILSVDDNRINLFFIKQFFKNTEHTILEATSLLEAKKTLETTKVNIIITDINLQDGTGWDLLNHVRTTDAYKDIKVLSTSASTEALDKPLNSKENWSFNGSLTKPFSDRDLWAAVDNAIEN